MNEDLTILETSKLSASEFANRLVKLGLVDKACIELAWKQLNPASRTILGLSSALTEQTKLTLLQARLVASDSSIPPVLGAYVLERELGHGGMGQVFLAVHSRMNRKVALKVIDSKYFKNDAATRRFQREVEATARLVHPNIITAHDAGEAGGVHFLVIEYLDGDDLLSLVQKTGPVCLEQALDYLRQIALGLSFAHQQGIVHRDIKPSNLMVGRQGVVKILDMGLARIESADELHGFELTATGVAMGTVDYMAPEQAVDAKKSSCQSDIYSLGCTLFFLLCGKPIFPGDSFLDRVIAHWEQPIPKLSTMLGVPVQVAHLGAMLDSLLSRMVAKKPTDRFGSMDEVVQAVDQLRATIDRLNSKKRVLLGSLVPQVSNHPTVGQVAGLTGTHKVSGDPLSSDWKGNADDVSKEAASPQSPRALAWRLSWVAGLSLVLLAVVLPRGSLPWVGTASDSTRDVPVQELGTSLPQEPIAHEFISSFGIYQVSGKVASWEGSHVEFRVTDLHIGFKPDIDPSLGSKLLSNEIRVVASRIPIGESVDVIYEHSVPIPLISIDSQSPEAIVDDFQFPVPSEIYNQADVVGFSFIAEGSRMIVVMLPPFLRYPQLLGTWSSISPTVVDLTLGPGYTFELEEYSSPSKAVALRSSTGVWQFNQESRQLAFTESESVGQVANSVPTFSLRWDLREGGRLFGEDGTFARHRLERSVP